SLSIIVKGLRVFAALSANAISNHRLSCFSSPRFNVKYSHISESSFANSRKDSKSFISSGLNKALFVSKTKSDGIIVYSKFKCKKSNQVLPKTYLQLLSQTPVNRI